MGSRQYAIPDVLNVFMENDDEETARTGRMAFRPSPATVDDYVTIQAEMDLLVGVSACPAYKSPVNAGVSKPLLLEIFPAPAE